jgi:hypothetical protein
MTTTLKENELNTGKELSDNNSKKFVDVRQQVKQLILDNSYREVTPYTEYNISGIYMIYIDEFTSDKIIPIYIGQAKDIQRRYKQHFCEILALNRLSHDEYYKYFFSKSYSFYEGNFKTCKIFKFMVDNNCSLQNYHIVILEETDEEHLEKKEQEYFQRLLPSFFGFNQINSLLRQINVNLAVPLLSSSEIDSYLDVLQEDIKGINSYYEYGYTKFNFEHSLPKNISYLLKNNDSLDNQLLSKYKKVQLMISELCKRYIPGYEEIKSEKQRLHENKNKLYEAYKVAENEYHYKMDLLERDLRKQFKELGFRSEKVIANFKDSIIYKDDLKYSKQFNKYLNSKKCDINFYEVFNKQIKLLYRKIQKSDDKFNLYQDALDLIGEQSKARKHKRYKMIFPSDRFDSFCLGDRIVNTSLKTSDEFDLPNTFHIEIFISNNAINRSFDINKEPFIIRLDYCYIGKNGDKTERIYYIDNETTKNCKAGLEYIEKDYYNIFTIRQERFNISSIINNQIDNSFISVLAEYKHGINDYSIKDKRLIKLSTVLDEILRLVDDSTRYNIRVSESNKCLERCMRNESLQNNWFVEKLLTNKLPKIRKS